MKQGLRLFLSTAVLLVTIASVVVIAGPLLRGLFLRSYVLPNLETLIHEKGDLPAAKEILAHWLEVLPENRHLMSALFELWLQDRDATLMKKAAPHYLTRYPEDTSRRLAFVCVLEEDGCYDEAIEQCEFILRRPDSFTEDDFVVFRTLKASIKDDRRKSAEGSVGYAP